MYLCSMKDLILEIQELTKTLHNDMDLGREVRKLIGEYEETQKSGKPFADDYIQ